MEQQEDRFQLTDEHDPDHIFEEERQVGSIYCRYVRNNFLKKF